MTSIRRSGPIPEAVLFDMDGTLVDTEDLWAHAESMVLDWYGSDWPAADQKAVIGGCWSDLIERMAARANQPHYVIEKALIDQIKVLIDDAGVNVLPGAKQLHQDVREAAIPTALVTNSPRRLADIVMNAAGFEFDWILGGDEVSPHKPDPHPYRLATHQFRARAEHCIVVEDSQTGINAGLGAGCHVVSAPRGNTITPHHRVLVVDSLAEMSVPALYGFVERALVAGRLEEELPPPSGY